MVLPEEKDLPVELEQRPVVSPVAKPGLDPGTEKRRLVLRIGDLALPAEGGELLSPPPAHRLDEALVRVADEIEERRGLAVLLSHEEEGDVGREKNDPGGEFQAFQGGEGREPLGEHPVSHLVVVLREDHQLTRVHVAGGIAVAAVAVG